uniref:Uncharacterized protein n=1 Tax=Lepeophtheirus salmonis TaxID=72036 RepID=A0A0K2U1H2_LEPSM
MHDSFCNITRRSVLPLCNLMPFIFVVRR